MCLLISRHDGIAGSELSDMLSVTRAAMSQTISKLKKKGFVRDAPDSVNYKRKTLHVTPLGKRAAEVAEAYARTMTSELFDIPREELIANLRFITKLETFHDRANKAWGLTDQPGH
nr:MarR family transcriptional regulator [Nocardia bovistercoris]